MFVQEYLCTDKTENRFLLKSVKSSEAVLAEKIQLSLHFGPS